MRPLDVLADGIGGHGGKLGAHGRSVGFLAGEVRHYRAFKFGRKDVDFDGLFLPEPPASADGLVVRLP